MFQTHSRKLLWLSRWIAPSASQMPTTGAKNGLTKTGTLMTVKSIT